MKKKHPKLKPPPEEEDLTKKLRHTHSVIAGLEDVIALLWAAIDESVRAILRIRSIAKKAVQILKVMRSGPNAYDAKNLRTLRKDQKKGK